MGQVQISVNGRSYEVGCDDGDEEKVRELSRQLDERVRSIAQAVGQVGEARLLLLASLTMADDLAEAQQEAEQLRAALKNAKDGPVGDAKAELEALARRLETVAERLEGT
jgi:cell division protein ZapA